MIEKTCLTETDSKSVKEILKQLLVWKNNMAEIINGNYRNDFDFTDGEHCLNNIKLFLDILYIPLNHEKWNNWGLFNGTLRADFNKILFNLHIYNHKQAIDHYTHNITKDLANHKFGKIAFNNHQIQQINHEFVDYYVFDSCPSGLPCNLTPSDVEKVLSKTIKMIKQNVSLAKLKMTA